jgi:hypothetical protein
VEFAFKRANQFILRSIGVERLFRRITEKQHSFHVHPFIGVLK